MIEVSTMLRFLKNDLISGRIPDENMTLALRNLLEDNDLGAQFHCFIEDRFVEDSFVDTVNAR